MGRGDTTVDGDESEENMAAWLLGVKNLQIQPYHLPPLGSIHPSTYNFINNTVFLQIISYLSSSFKSK